MPAIWSFLEVSDRPYGPWHSAYRHPWTHIPPMSWLLCRPLLPQLNLSAPVPNFRVRPLLQVRLLPPGSARSFRSAYVPDKSACSGPPTPHWSVRVCRRVNVQPTSTFLSCRERSRIPASSVSLFRDSREEEAYRHGAQ